MANLKNKKTSVAKDTKAAATSTKATPVAAAQSAVASKNVTKTASETKSVKPAVKEDPAKTVEVKETPAKAEAAKPAVKKTVAKKASTKKPVAKKATTKKVVKEVVEEVYFEYNGEQLLSKELVDRIKETYKNEGHRISSIKSLRVYINPDERKAYYVINDKAEGKFVEF